MNDSEFDKRFADKMRQAGAPDLSHEDWERLSVALDADQRKRWRILPLWWLGALSALLLCSNIGWWWMWQQSEKRSEVMQAEWQQIRQAEVTKRDTSWSKVVVYQYDTIYRSVVLQAGSESVSQSGSAVLGLLNKIQLIPEKTAASGHLSTTASPTGDLLSNLDTQKFPQDTSEQMLKNVALKGAIEWLPIAPCFVKIPVRPFKLTEKDFVLLPLRRPHTPQQSLLIPKKIRLGAGTGIVIPSASGLTGNGGYLFSLNGEIAFSEQLALTFEGAYNEVGFTGRRYNQSLGLPLPNSPGNDYVLKYFKPEEGLKPIVQLTAGMRYWWRATHLVSPYLGLGYAMQWHLPFELQFEYIDKFTGQEIERSIEAPALGSAVSLMDLNIGVRYRIWRQLSLQTGASYQFKMDSNQPGIPRYWGITSAVLYTF